MGILSLFGRKISRLLIGCLVFANGALVGWVLDSFMDIKMKVIIILRLTKWGNRAFLSISTTLQHQKWKINILYFCHVNFHFKISNRRSWRETGFSNKSRLTENSSTFDEFLCVLSCLDFFFVFWPFSIKVWFFIKKKNCFCQIFTMKYKETWEMRTLKNYSKINSEN